MWNSALPPVPGGGDGPGRKGPERGPWQEAADVGSVGLEMAIAVAIGFFGGRWLDGKLGTGEVLQWVGLGFGIAAAALAVVRVSRKYLRDVERDERRGRRDGDGGL